MAPDYSGVCCPDICYFIFLYEPSIYPADFSNHELADDKWKPSFLQPASDVLWDNIVQMAPSSCRHYNISDEDVQAIMDGTGDIENIQVRGREKISHFSGNLFSGELHVCHLQQVELWWLRIQRHHCHRERLGLRNRPLCRRSLHPWSCGPDPGNLRVQVFFFFFWLFSCPEQLNRWPCHSLTDSVTFWFLHYRVTLDFSRIPLGFL